MNPLVVVIGGVALLGGGYLAYKFVQASSPINQIKNLANQAVGSVGSGLDDVATSRPGQAVINTGESGFFDLEHYL
jgi:hypothetical protein